MTGVYLRPPRGKDRRPRKRRPTLPLAERLERFTDKSGGPDACWPWTGGTTSTNGERRYGIIGIDHRSHVASRVVYELHHGPIPDGLWVLHRCDNPPCVNPAHLFLGAPHDNSADMRAKGRARGGAITPLRGDANPGAKLTDAQVLEIRALHARGVSYKDLAARYPCCAETVSQICRRRSWTHI